MVEYRSFENPEIDETWKCRSCEVSVIVPTYYKERSFPGVVNSIAMQLSKVLNDEGNPIKAEIILVINGDEGNDAPAVKIANELMANFKNQISRLKDLGGEGWKVSDYKKYESMPFMIPLKIVRYSEKLGKMAAMQKGAEVASGDVVVFVDADLVFSSDRPFLLQELIRPVSSGGFKMSIASLGNNWGNKGPFAKWLSGQRSLYREEFLKIADWLKKEGIGGYGIETALSLVISKFFGSDKIRIVDWSGVSQLTKIYKDPVVAPLNYLKMRRNVIQTFLRVRRLLKDPEKLKELQELLDFKN